MYRKTLSLFTLLLASVNAAGMQTTGGCSDCPLKYEVVPFEKRVIPEVYVGWNNQPTHVESDLSGPMLIPIEVSSKDEDELLMKCADGCVQMTVPSAWTINWEVDGYDSTHPWYPWRNGSFVDAKADRHHVLENRWAVLYLPPEDLAMDESRAFEITATVVDHCKVGVDKDSTVTIAGVVLRTISGWTVSMVADEPVIPEEDEPECEGKSDPCELVGPFIVDGEEPMIDIMDFPDVMYVDEVRPLTFGVTDEDTILAECGIPTKFCSTFDQEDICDEVTYMWSQEPVDPNKPGSGLFEFFGTMGLAQQQQVMVPEGQTVMFSAVVPGLVRVKVRAESTSGDFLEHEHVIDIQLRKTKFVDFSPAGQLPIYIDGTFGLTYDNIQTNLPGVEWVDVNDDGFNNLPGEQDFPMAYVRGSTPLLQFLVQIGSDGPMMPGAVILGGDSTLALQYLSRIDAFFHLTAPTVLIAFGDREVGALPNVVGRHDHGIAWETRYINHRDPVHLGYTQHRIYTTLDSPLDNESVPLSPMPADANTKLDSAFYRYWESAYDIACTNGLAGALGPEGKSSVQGVFDAMLAKFATKRLRRKDEDGINIPDNQLLYYWGDVGPPISGPEIAGNQGPQAPASCTDLASMLEVGGSFDGSGRCRSFAQLFRLCLGLHGLPSLGHEFAAFMRPRVQVGVNQGITLDAWQRADILIKNYNFTDNVMNEVAEMIRFTPPAGYARLAPVSFRANTDLHRLTSTGANREFYFYDKTQYPGRAWASATDQVGVEAQGGVQNPVSFFPSHALVRYMGKFYDPSYGDSMPYMGATDMDAAQAYAAANVSALQVRDITATTVPPGNGFGPLPDAVAVMKFWDDTLDKPGFTLTPGTF